MVTSSAAQARTDFSSGKRCFFSFIFSSTSLISRNTASDLQRQAAECFLPLWRCFISGFGTVLYLNHYFLWRTTAETPAGLAAAGGMFSRKEAPSSARRVGRCNKQRMDGLLRVDAEVRHAAMVSGFKSTI